VSTISSIFVLFDPGIEVTAVEMHAAAYPHDGQFALKNEMLHGLFAAAKVDSRVLDVEQRGLDAGRWSTPDSSGLIFAITLSAMASTRLSSSGSCMVFGLGAKRSGRRLTPGSLLFTTPGKSPPYI